MAVQCVNVVYYGEGSPLGLDKLDVELGPGDQVQWNFYNVPPRCMPFIYFPGKHHSASRQTFGPFQYLEPSVSTVVALGNSGHHGDYPYVAMILNKKRAVATSAGIEARIRNRSAPENTSPDALVRYDEKGFHVTPNDLKLERERTAIWYIEGIPEGHFVTFRFKGFRDRPMRGPFLSFSLSRGFHGAWLANGAGFLSSHLHLMPGQLQKPISYQVRLRDSYGRVVDGHDPVIEPLESPPGGG